MFGGRSKFSRHIELDQRLPRKRPAPAAFEPNPGDPHLSIHSLQVESKSSIARRYKERQRGRGSVAMCVHSIYEYNSAAEGTPAQVIPSEDGINWFFLEGGKITAAYRQSGECASHCGIEYIRVLDTHRMRQVARRLARRNFEVVKPARG
jgi:hypothetical protein